MPLAALYVLCILISLVGLTGSVIFKLCIMTSVIKVLIDFLKKKIGLCHALLRQIGFSVCPHSP